MSKSTASIAKPSDFVILKTQKLNNVPIQGTYPIYVRGASLCCINKNTGVQEISPIVIPKK
jgi:hypothetical protein